MDIKPSRIVWHHSADNSTKAQFAKIDAYHKTRDFPKSSLGFYVGYHYLIEHDGRIIQARKETEIGAHDTGENINSIGICLAGNFNITYPTTEQAISAAQLIKDIRTRFNIPITRIEPHRWDDTTDCPGTLLPDNWLIEQFLKYEGSVATQVFHWLGKTYNLI
jgi:N-acetyl-anhydromuramyl-L-alanine amidase AmpD